MRFVTDLAALALSLFVALPTPDVAAQHPESVLAEKLLNAKTDDERNALVPPQYTPAFADALHDTLEHLKADRAKAPQSRAFSLFVRQLATANNDRKLVGTTYLTEANTYYDEGQLPRARQSYDEAVAIMREVGDKASLATALFDQALISRIQGDNEGAAKLAEEALPLALETNSIRTLGGIYNCFGLVEKARGRFDRAVASFSKAIEYYDQDGEFESMKGARLNLANTYNESGDQTRAEEQLNRVLAAAEKEGNDRLTSYALNSLGSVYDARNEPDRALAAFRRSLAIKEKRGDKASMTSSMMNIGEVYRKSDRFAEAFESYQKALSVGIELHDAERVGSIESDLAYLALADHKPHLALYFAEVGSQVAHVTSSARVAISASIARGGALQRLERYDEARRSYEDAIATTERERVSVPTAQARQQFLAVAIEPYVQLVHLMYVTHNGEAALRYAEAAKARVLLDALQNVKFDRSKVLTNDERKHEDALEANVEKLTKARARGKPDEQAAAELDRVRRELDVLQLELHAKYPRLRTQRGEAEFAGNEMLQSLVDKDTALLEYVVSDPATFVIVATRRNGRLIVDVHSIKIREEQVGRAVESLRSRIAKRDLGINDACSKTFAKFLGPVWKDVRAKHRIIIVPDGALWELPFQALRAPDGKFLIEHAALSYAPSATALAAMRDLERARTSDRAAYAVVALGNSAGVKSDIGELPALPDAGRQLERIGRLYRDHGARAFVEDLAPKSLLIERADDARILHIATHGVFNDANPMYSYLVLARGGQKNDDGIFEAWELAKLDLKSQLVILSACETARGTPRKGEGLIGMTWALFVAGSPSTIVSQWKVDSASTTAFMLQLHGALSAPQPIRKSEALRGAALALLQESKWRHPFYWAPFVLVGDESPLR
jgi:CHAT domain-containing protein/tetratricopeptide (TPR) repeat protein